MGIALFRKKTDAQMEKARAALSSTQAKLAELNEQRKKMLLSSDDDTVIEAIDRTLEEVTRTERTQADRVRLLEEQAAQDEAARVAKRRANHIERLISKLADADDVAAEIEDDIRGLAEKVDRLVDLREAVGAAWPLSLSDTETGLLGAMRLRKYLEFEFYRASAKPFGGGISLPGSASPDDNFTLQPERIKPFSAAVREASNYIASVMRGQGS